jgi:dephospho-CoA kinase
VIRGRPVIGLVGGIGAGKSAVASIWAELGCAVSHSDDLARSAFEEQSIRDVLLAWWGPRILDALGRIDRRAIGAIVFADEAERRRLEGLVHPWIERAREASFAAAPPSTRAFVIDAPLLFEAGLDRICDAVVFIDAPSAARLERLGRTRGWSADELARREAAQWPLDRKRASAHHVLRNAGDMAALRDEARRLLETIELEVASDRRTATRTPDEASNHANPREIPSDQPVDP